MDEDQLISAARLSDMRALNDLTENLSRTSENFGRSITNSFARGIVEGKRFEDVLRNVGKAMTTSLLRSALNPLQTGISSLLNSGVKSLTGMLTGGLGGGASMPVTPFADGGIVASPSYFPLGRGLGLMGESGAEAIMPLARGPDGRLGIRGGGGASGRPLSVVVQVSTPDADSFRRSEAQVSAAVARAVARGSRAL